MKKMCGVMAVLICVFLTVACGRSTAEKWQEQYDLGMRYLEEQNYEEAIVAFTAAIEIDPNQAVIYIGRGDAYAKYQDMENHLELALADYSQALELDDSIPEAYLGMADVYVQQEDYDRALEILQKGHENTGASEIDEQIERVKEMKPEYVTDISEENSNESDSTEGNIEEVVFENDELTVIKEDDRTGMVSLKGLDIKDSYSIMDMDGEEFVLWNVMLDIDNGTWFGLESDCGNVFQEDKTSCTFEEVEQLLRYYVRSGDTVTTSDISTLETVYTADSITWTFTIPENIEFDFSRIVNYRVDVLVYDDPSYGFREYAAE